MSWKKVATSRSLGEKAFIGALIEEGKEPKYFIIPKKLNYSNMQKLIGILQKTGVSASDKELTNAELEQASTEANNDFEKMLPALKIAFLTGTHDHNFDDDEGTKLSWNEDLFNATLEFPEVLLEIFKIVMEQNRPLQDKTSKK